MKENHDPLRGTGDEVHTGPKWGLAFVAPYLPSFYRTIDCINTRIEALATRNVWENAASRGDGSGGVCWQLVVPVRRCI